ncbi:ParB N-terminal domain-containing protein [Sulfoacidibacillus ferrooxidans]|uniref:ParB-like N-terminal domain-containing protein n=1 Tax=Sulfoacidibacillus ferrooxidans TaxID=2005001 RepID=A0A9X1VED7_9BACL|nr:ParB N-terminal domain-containing protein [Sulfoacidibacillus ferrooxidans]MCI0184633.1 hypothetical protein [Sulfoacidibacillus ferrooxidans]
MGRIVHVNPRELLPHPEYSKYHSDRIQLASDYERIKDSIHKNGIREPLIAIEGSNILVCGHKRRMISIELGLDTVPVVYEVIEEEKSIERMVEDNLSRTQSEKDPIIIGEIVVLAKKYMGLLTVVIVLEREQP